MHVDVDGRELLAHTKLLAQLPALAEHARPLYVVGVAEADLFWRDIRRVLFSSARYRMLCRLGRGGAQSEWTPVKLMDVLEGAVPTLRDVIDEIPSLLASMGTEEQSDDAPAQLLRKALQRYAQEVTAIYGHPLSADDLAARGLPTAEQCEGYSTLETRRAAFGALTDALAEELHFTPQPEVLAACRTEALIEGQLLAPGSVATGAQQLDGSSEDNSVRYIDCEIVAVYW